MKFYLKRFRHLIALAVIVSFAVIGIALDMLHPVTGVCIVALWQLSQFCASKRCGACFNTVLTREQLKEFESIIKGLAEYRDLFPSIKEHWGDVRELPGLVEKIRTDLDNLRRSHVSVGTVATPQAGRFVSDGCARYLAAIAITLGEKTGKLDGLNATQRDALLSESRSILGISQRTALTSSDIPLPVGYSGEVVALVNQHGSARRYGTVFPLGNGSLKLPRLKTDTAFGLIGQSATVTEKSPQTEWITFDAEKFGGLIRLPAEMAEDSIVGIGNFIADFAARKIAEVEDQVYFLNLDGSTYGAVEGLCASTITNSKVLQMASTKTHYSDATLSNVRGLRAVPDAAALRMGAYYMHPSFEQLLASYNTAGDRPYNPNAQLANASSAQPFINGPTLDGFPVRWVPIMPAYSTSANASKVFMLFGDLSYQYLGLRGIFRFDISKEAAFETDEILIRAIERFTIGLMALGAVGGLQTAAS